MKLADATSIADGLTADLAPGCERIQVAGSIRRRKAEVGDIELVAIPKLVSTGQASMFGGPQEMRSELHAVITNLGEDRVLPVKTRTSDPRWPIGFSYSHPEWRAKATAGSKFWKLWLSRHHIAVDLFMPTAETWAAILTIRTGSAGFSQALVTQYTKSTGGHFHEGRLHQAWKIGDPVVARTKDGRTLGPPLDIREERDVFDACGVRWVEPEDRHGPEQVRP